MASRRWYCTTCHSVLGRVVTTPGGLRILRPARHLQLILVRPEHTFTLICTGGHLTTWHGDGIRFDPRKDAA